MLKRGLMQLCVGGLVAAFMFLPQDGSAAQRKKSSSSQSVAKKSLVKKAAVKKTARPKAVRKVVAVAPPRPSYGQLAGLHGMQDELDLRSSVALVVDQDTNEVLFSKNESACCPSHPSPS